MDSCAQTTPDVTFQIEIEVVKWRAGYIQEEVDIVHQNVGIWE